MGNWIQLPSSGTPCIGGISVDDGGTEVVEMAEVVEFVEVAEVVEVVKVVEVAGSSSGLH